MSEFVEYFVIVEPLDADGSPHPLYWGTVSLQTGPLDDPADTFFEDRLLDAGNFEQHLFSDGTTRGESSTGVGDIVVVRLSNDGPDEDVSPHEWFSWKFKGAPIRIVRWTGVGLLSSAEVIFYGTAQRILADQDTFILQIHDRLSDLDWPFLRNRYLGTSIGPGLGIEGNADLEGQLKQKVYGGPNYSVKIQWANPYDNIGQVSDGPVQAIGLLSGGNPMTSIGDVGDLAQLLSATVTLGQYVTCCALGVFKSGTSPATNLELTANVTEGPAAADRTMAQIVKRMAIDFGLGEDELELSTFDALDELNSAPCGIVVSDESTAKAVMLKVLASDIGFLLSNSDNLFEVGRLDLPDDVEPMVLLDEDVFGNVDYVASSDTDNGDPAGRVVVRYAEVNNVLNDSQLAGSLTVAQKDFFKNQWRTSVAEDAEVLADDSNAPEIIIDSRFVNKPDADAAAARALLIYATSRMFVRVEVVDFGEIASVGCNDVVALSLNDLNVEDEKRFRVLSRIPDLQEESGTLLVWA